jgi:hypothetical protein
MHVLELDGPAADRTDSDCATEVLESGGLILFPNRSFELSADERRLLDPAILNGRAKNASLDLVTGEVRGVEVDGERQGLLTGMIGRFAATADAVLAELTPTYGPALQRRRTSFRPGAVAERALSPRKDDRRLHVDAFPSNPTHGRRILRVFANVNPHGQARVWEVGEEGFEPTARRFRHRLTARGRTAGLKAALGLTRGRQSAYDQIMLQLHDAAKLDDAYQGSAPKRRLELPAGCMWVVYTDSVMHAALSGQHAFEQTYLLPVEAMQAPEASPLRVLERVTGRKLV